MTLLTKFWPNFKGVFQEPCLTDANCHIDICIVKIYPGNLSSISEIYQLLLTQFWLNFIDMPLSFYIRFFLTEKLVWTKIWRMLDFVDPTYIFIGPTFLSDLIFLDFNFLDQIFFIYNFFGVKIFFGPNNFCTKNYF